MTCPSSILLACPKNCGSSMDSRCPRLHCAGSLIESEDGDAVCMACGRHFPLNGKGCDEEMWALMNLPPGDLLEIQAKRFVKFDPGQEAREKRSAASKEGWRKRRALRAGYEA